MPHIAFGLPIVAFAMSLFSSLIPFTGSMNTMVPSETFLLPAGYAFGIWFFIYIFSIACGWYQFQHKERFGLFRIYFSILMAFNIFYYFVSDWYAWVFPLFVLFMFCLYKMSVLMMQDVRDKDLWFVILPTSMHFGWITAAFPVASTSFLITEFDFTGIQGSFELWAVLYLVAIFLFAFYLVYSDRAHYIYLLTIAWGLAALVVRSVSIQAELVATTAAILLAIGLVYAFACIKKVN